MAEYTARHAEIVCAKLETLLRDAKPTAAAVAKARAIEGELETAVLEPIFQLYPDLRRRDLATADAPGAQVKLGSFTAHAEPRMGPTTAGHLSWVANDAEQRTSALGHLIRSKEIELAEDIASEANFVGAPAEFSYPKLAEMKMRELAKHPPKQPRTESTDAAFRKSAPPEGSVKVTPAAAERMRAFLDEVIKQAPGCHVLAVDWSSLTRWRGPDDATWHEKGPSLGIGAWDCGQYPADVVRTVGGMKVVFNGDTADRFAGKTIDLVDKRFVFSDR